MFKDVKVVAIIMLLVGGAAGFTGAKVINSTTNISQQTVEQAVQENAELRAQIAELNAKLDRAEATRTRRINDIEAEGRRLMGTKPKHYEGRKMPKPKGY